MEIRAAEPADGERIRAIARDSFRSSYSLSPQEIETILEDVFAEETLGERITDSDAFVLVADHAVDDTETVQGFVDADVGSERVIRWLHVDPTARGAGIGTALFDRVREDGGEQPLTARILEDAVEGGEFLERFGLERSGNDRTEFGDAEFAVAVFTEGGGSAEANEPSVPVPESVTAEDVSRPVERDDPIPGREAPFFPIFAGDEREEKYGYFCSECGSTAIAADGLDRLECGNCGNEHQADEWDDAYL